MVLNWNIKQIVKKKYLASIKDKKDWETFTKQIENISPKEVDLLDQNVKIKKTKKLDLHGFSLEESNKMVKKFINESFNNGHKKLLIVTGKGTRSKSHENPYISKTLSVLRYSIPEYIKNNEFLNNKISSITKASLRDGGEGAIYVNLKKNKNFKE